MSDQRTNAEREDLILLRADGRVVAREVFVFTCYFDVSHEKIAAAIAEGITDFARMVSFDALSLYYDNEGEPQTLNASSIVDLFDLRFFGRFKTPNANIILSSDNDGVRDYFLWYNGKELPSPLFETEVGYLWLWMPRAAFLARRQAVIDYILALLQRVPFSAAYASLGLAERHKREMQALARRYPGLDISQPLCVSADLGHKVPGAFWMTFLGGRLTAACGGADALRQALAPDIGVRDLQPEGTLVLLNDDPEIGDVNRGNLLPHHRSLARLLDGLDLLHVPERVVYFVDENGLADRAAQVAWHRRFVDE